MVKEVGEELKKILRSKSAVIPNLLMILNGFPIVFYSKNIGHMPKIESVYQYPFCWPSCFWWQRIAPYVFLYCAA